MLATAFMLDGPCAIRYPRGNGLGVQTEAMKVLPIGKSEVIQEGDAGLVVSVGTRFADAKAALESLREEGRAFTLLNLRFIKPLDTDLVAQYLQAGKPLVVIEEGSKQGGVGEAIATFALQQSWQGPFKHLAMPDVFPEHGTQAEILRDLHLDQNAICDALRKL